VDRDFKIESHRAYAYSVNHLFQLKQRNILISVGRDDDTLSETIKIWNTEKIDKIGLLQTIRIEGVRTGMVKTLRTSSSSFLNIHIIFKNLTSFYFYYLFIYLGFSIQLDYYSYCSFRKHDSISSWV
jgi:hypothetical protein